MLRCTPCSYLLLILVLNLDPRSPTLLLNSVLKTEYYLHLHISSFIAQTPSVTHAPPFLAETLPVAHVPPRIAETPSVTHSPPFITVTFSFSSSSNCLSDNTNKRNSSRSSCISCLEHSFNEMLGRPSDAEASAASSSSELVEAPQLIRDLLVECAEAVSDRQWQRSIHFITLLLQRISSPTTTLEGDSMERVIAQFIDSLASRVASSIGDSHGQALLMQQFIHQRQSYGENVRSFPSWRSWPSLEEVQGAYLCFNQVTPFMRFTHLTATQAILEALEGGPWDCIHILDMEIMQGVQWPPLLQALQQRFGGGGLAPARVRISGVGKNVALLEQTGNHLSTFARSLGLHNFEFKAIQAAGLEELTSYMQSLLQENINIDNSNGNDCREALVVNATSFLMQLPRSSSISSAFLSTLQSLHPVIVTLADRESNYDSGSVGERFGQAFLHYSALFESLEATLPPSSSERIKVENVWLRSQILGLCNTEDRVAEISNLIDGPCPKWRDLLRAHGFNPVSHSDFAKSQAKLLLRLHYPSEGYRVQEYGDCLLLGWRGTPLFAVSAWN